MIVGWLGVGVEVHAELVVVAELRQLVAVHALRPREAVLDHERLAASPDSQTQRAAGRQWLGVVDHADRRVHTAHRHTRVPATVSTRCLAYSPQPAVIIIIIIAMTMFMVLSS